VHAWILGLSHENLLMISACFDAAQLTASEPASTVAGQSARLFQQDYST
jgi:hypothetical protein